MSHGLFGDARLYVALLEFDRELRDERRQEGCDCGGVLHVSDYERKPRGVAEDKLPAGYGRRFSLCCAREGCRRRATPASLRFLGRRVYVAVVVVLTVGGSAIGVNVAVAFLYGVFGLPRISTAGFIAMLIAFVLAYRAGQLNDILDWLLTFLNGCLIYCATSGMWELGTAAGREQPPEGLKLQSRKKRRLFSSWYLPAS